MDLTMLGAGIISGNMIGKLMFRNSEDGGNGLDITIECIALLLIIGSHLQLFGG